MREQGGGTLFSQVIDRPKLSVKVAAAAESNESKRRLSNGGSTYVQSYAGAVGPKAILGGSILQASSQASMQQRLKGGSAGTMLVDGQRHSTVELHDFSTVERLKELRAKLEPLLKTRPAHSPSPPPLLPLPPEESAMAVVPLPQWGLGKRPRRSRLDVSKDAAPARALPLRTADEAMNPVRGAHGWSHSTSAFMESDGHSSKGATVAARNYGINSSSAANGCASGRPGIIYGERAGGGPLHKGEPSTSVRQRSEGSAEAPVVNSHSNGHMVGATHSSRVIATSEAATTSPSLHVKPRSELQTLEWPRVIIGLSRKEKEDDFLMFKGSKLPQRPKKRPKVVERTLHYCTPGNLLCDLVRGRYDVREKKSVKKKPRGLKAMESVESESE